MAFRTDGERTVTREVSTEEKITKNRACPHCGSWSSVGTQSNTLKTNKQTLANHNIPDLSLLNPQNNLMRQVLLLAHLMIEKMQTQRGLATFPMSYSQTMLEASFKVFSVQTPQLAGRTLVYIAFLLEMKMPLSELETQLNHSSFLLSKLVLSKSPGFIYFSIRNWNGDNFHSWIYT